ncbi:YggS family pyridoxal phosphate-dependent enzyme [Aquipuribacter nitratireducens]|uniref:Pyridoxal phosphate homeostasis protein n=1 Tax=Aquipuribacter nitratireducens TaxID=650104 RepID=A0ABW0GRP5_9MICO
MSEDARRAELVSALGRVRARIADACAAAGRRTTDVTLVVVTKTYPADDVRRLAGIGVRDVGEARLPELRDKRAALAGDEAVTRLRWHAIGRLQRNKARATARLADTVHSVDDPRLVPVLARGAADAAEDGAAGPLGCFVQVSLDGDPERGGVRADALLPLCEAVATAEGLALLGLMAVAPLGADPDRAFARLRELSDEVVAAHPSATAVSAGMSGDLEQAVRHGATHLRVGAAVLGPRPPLG